MKAAVQHIYGPPSVLQVKEVPQPGIREDELLVRVYATTVNRTDCAVVQAKPLPLDCKRTVLFIQKLMEAGQFKAVIDREYPLEDVVEAYTYVETGQKTGNVVLVMN